VDRLVDVGVRVVVVDNLQAGRWENIAYPERCAACMDLDVRDRDAVHGLVRDVRPDYVFHLAANASVPGSVEDPRYDFESNCCGTFVLLDVLREQGLLPRFILASSAAVYGEPTRFPLTEESRLNPISPYGAGKVSAEFEGRVFCGVYGLPFVAGRIFNTYGPRMPRFVVLDFLRKLQQDPGCLEILGTGRQVRDFTFVSDTVAGLLWAGVAGIPGEAYNIASGTSHSVTELADVLLDILGLQGRTRLVYTGESWRGDAQRWEVDVSRLRELGYRPGVSLRRGLATVVEWFEQCHGRIV